MSAPRSSVSSILTGEDVLMHERLLSEPPAEREEGPLRHLVDWIALQRNPVFEEVSTDFLVELCRTSSLIAVDADDIVFYQRARESQAFIVLTGKLSAYSTTPMKLKMGSLIQRRQNSGLLLQRRLSPGSTRRNVRHLSSEDTEDEHSPSPLPLRESSRSSSEPFAIHLIGQDDCTNNGGRVARSQSPAEKSRTLTGQRLKRRKMNRNVFGTFIGHIFEGQVFGEMALLKPGIRRDMAVLADEPTKLISINFTRFQDCAENFQREDLHEKTSLLEKIDVFKGWSWSLLFHLAHSFTREEFGYQSFIVRQGEPARKVFFILSGQAKVLVNVKPDKTQQESVVLTPNTRRKKAIVKELSSISGQGSFGLGEMLSGMNNYAMSLQTTEPTVVISIKINKLMWTAKKFHPESLASMMDIVQQRNALYESRIYDISLVTDLYQDGMQLVNVEKEEKARSQSQRDKLPPILSRGSLTGHSTPRSPLIGRAGSSRSEISSPSLPRSPSLGTPRTARSQTPTSYGGSSHDLLDPFSDVQQKNLSAELCRLEVSGSPVPVRRSPLMARRAASGRFDEPTSLSPLSRRRDRSRFDF